MPGPSCNGATRSSARVNMKISHGLFARLELTLAIIKPDVVVHPHKLQEITDIILKNDFLFVRSKAVCLSRSEAGRFYQEHQERFFYNRLVGFMASGPMSVHILAKEDAIGQWRRLMGPTKTIIAKHTAPESLRARFGLTDTRNATHGSDSPETAAREISFFFPDFNIADWYATEEPLFRTGFTLYRPEDGIHTVVTDNSPR